MNRNEFDLLNEKYLKLVHIHGECQKQNSLLEERILNIVETYSDEKQRFEQDLIRANEQIKYLQDTVEELQVDKQRYKDDCNLAVRLLHQHPGEFIATSTGQCFGNQQTIPAQRSILMPTFPPMFVPTPPLLPTSTNNLSNETTTNDNLRLAEALFKSNSVHRSPSTQYICSNCSRTVKLCDVSVQTSLDSNTARLRLISSTSDDDIPHENDGTWLSLDSPHEHQLNKTRQTISEKNSNSFSTSNIPGVYNV